jgi:peptidoglycan/xylan/chitin deacetylase (PgdA/CDA1 family)
MALLLVVLSAPSQAAFPWPWAGAAEQTAEVSGEQLQRSDLRETAELFPTWAEWSGEGRIIVPGVYTTRRMTVDAATGRPVSIELALAEPRMVHSYRGGGDHPPRIALTFDDGPSATYTPQLLEILAKHNARCTFFTLGALVGSHRQILKRAEQEGHEIGIHSWWHASYTGLSTAAIQADIARCRAALDGAVERPIRWVRPPYGAVDGRVRGAINDAGYRVAMWSVDPHDWRQPGSGAIASHILSHARDGAVVVLHDGGGNRAGTVAAMRTVVPELRKRGFELVTLSELTGLTDPPPQERGMRLAIGDEVFEVVSEFEDVKLTVDGVAVELTQPPVMINSQFLAQARPVLTALGSKVRWDQQNLAVAFDGARGEFVVKLNSLDVTLQGDQLLVRVPSLYYRGTAMIPVGLMANAAGAAVNWDPAARVIEFTTTSAGRSRPAPDGLMSLRRHDGTRICWWPESPLLSLLPPGVYRPARI